MPAVPRGLRRRCLTRRASFGVSPSCLLARSFAVVNFPIAESHKGAVEDDPKDARLLFVSSSADLPTKPDPVIAPTAATPPLADAALKTTDAAAAPEAPGDLAAIETPAAATDAPAAAPVATPVAVVAARARPTRGRGRGGRGGHVASGRATAAASSSVATGASTAGNKKEREPFYFDVTFVGDCLDQKKWLPLGQYIVTKHDSDEEAKSDDVVSQGTLLDAVL